MKLVSVTSAQLFHHKTLSPFANFYGNNWIWKVSIRLHFRKYPSRQWTKTSQRENFCFIDKKVSKSTDFNFWNPISTLPLWILFKPWTLFQKNTITAKIVSPTKCLEERKKLTITLQVKQLVSHSSVRIRNTIPVYQIAIAMNTNSAFNGSNTEVPFWYHQFDFIQIRILRGSQPIIHFDAVDKCRLYVTTMKAMNFQDDIPSIPIDNFKDQYVLVLDLISMQEATEMCHCLELVGEPLRLVLNFTFPREHVFWTHCIGWMTVFGCK